MDNVIVICPCCASPVDARAAEQPQRLDCITCGQVWEMVVDARRQKEHALT